ncbi:Elongation factor 1-alpha (EF-1-alpha) (14 nm filament-associated protein) [Durusdinium trenchii]|uniref:Elongation factor 1-alpha (EF-1-alpha) (14 nm filament-associated protein) n=1 Tax=Durusdinium trenchii TaxID=1381693 RepID=A0ABP0N6K0_9DINO
MSKPQVSLAVMGPSQCGKTTALGKLCALSGAFEEVEHQQCQDLAWELGRPGYSHGWMLDRLPEERELGSTLTSHMQRFESAHCSYCAFDTPGREDLSREVLSVTSLADVAVLVLSATTGEWEAAVESGRVKEIALDSFTMGIKHVVVWVTKMDDFTVQFDMARYEEIKKAVTQFLKDVGYKPKDPFPVVPIGGRSGENLTSKSTEMPWYAGHSALEALDSLNEMNRPAEKPLRLPVLKVHDHPEAGCIIVGRVETGSIRSGLKVIFAPGGLVGEVKSVFRGGKKISEASGGDVVSVNLGGVDPSQLRRGMVASTSSDAAADAETFLAQVVVFDHPGQIRTGYCPAITVHTSQVPCEFEELLSKVDRKTGNDSETHPASAKSGEVIKVKMRPRSLVCVEPFSAYPPLGRFAIRDQGKTVGVGVIKEVTKRPVPKPRSENSYFDS